MELVSLLFAIIFMIIIMIYDKYMKARELAKIRQQQATNENQQYQKP